MINPNGNYPNYGFNPFGGQYGVPKSPTFNMPQMPNTGYNVAPYGGGYSNVNPFSGFSNYTGAPSLAQPSGIKGIQKVSTEAVRPSLSGKGTIDGVNFKSAERERYEMKVQAGKTYNLLSDVGVGLNGKYGTVGGETVLTDVAINVGGKIVTMADDGTLRIDGKAFDKKKNNLNEQVIENKDGTFTVKANGYEFELNATAYGLKLKIDAQNARNPEGLWGISLDGEDNTEAELQKAIRESEYVVADTLTFDYEDHNNIGEKYALDLDDEQRIALAWNARSPQYASLNLKVNGSFSIDDPTTTASNPDLNWSMAGLVDGSVYNVFSDEGIQVNGKFTGGKPQELAFVVDGDEIKVKYNSTGAPTFTVNGTVETNYNSGGVIINTNQLTITCGDADDENYTFTVSKDNTLNASNLALAVAAKNVGSNATRSTGLLGDAISANLADSGLTTDDNGLGYLRNAAGSLSKTGDDMTKAFKAYLMDSLFDTSSGRSVYE